MAKPHEVGVGRRSRAARARNPRRISRDGVVVGRRVPKDMAISGAGCLTIAVSLLLGCPGVALLAGGHPAPGVAALILCVMFAVAMNHRR